MSTTDTNAAPLPKAGGSYTRDPATGDLTLASVTELPADRADTQPTELGTARAAPSEVEQLDAPDDTAVTALNSQE